MATISKLIEKLASWKKVREALDELSSLPLTTKRSDVYPRVIEVAVEDWCVRDAPSGCGYEVERITEFLLRELAVHPALCSELYAAMPHAPTQQLCQFYNLARDARDAGANRLLRGMWRRQTSGWGYAVVAVHGASDADDPLADSPLADDAIEALEASPMYNDLEFATAAAIFAGERALEPLIRVFKSKEGDRRDGLALGLALAGSDDAVFFKTLSVRGEGANAKRIFAVTHKPKQKDRLAALEALAKDFAAPPILLFVSRLVLDDDPVIAERAAKLLADYSKPLGEHQTFVHHAYFLAHARKAIARGVSPALRALLDAVQSSIPRAPTFGAGPVAPAAVPAIDLRKASAEHRAREALEAMGVPPAPGKAKAANPDATAKPARSTGSKRASKPFGASIGALAAVGSGVRETLPAKAGTHRDPDLEAQILEDPSDRARFVVYSDWLQQQGDPRGALIALHDKADQGDKTAADAAALLLVEHRYALLGLLDGVAEIELDWELGFIRQARLRYASQATLLAGLETLLAAESARFLKSIAIDPIERKQPEAAPIVTLLLERAPKTLTQLHIGKPGMFTIPAELFAAFPRLQRDPAVVWAEVTAAISEQRKLKVDLVAKKLPALVARVPGIEADATQILIGLKAELDKQRPIGVIAALVQTFTRDSLDRFAHGMLTQWIKDQTVKWAFDAVGLLGGDACAAILGAHLAEWSHARSLQACEHLRRIGTDLAVCEIAGLVLRAAGPHPRRIAARELLEQLAAERRIDVDTLLVRTCPTELQHNSSGRLTETQRNWFMQVMTDGIRIAPADFRRHVCEHPLRQPLAATLLWGAYAQQQLVATFAVARDGSLR
ncbi:MAG: TIGR02996 domain-containing protein, partial [Deltaproteobacteria bacterium]|nr:TIGR02996 domain-containing protein [Deltaproteobacteria bacterium]